MIKIKLNVALYFPILYRYITAYTTSTAQMHSELVRYRPIRNSAKAGFYAFSTNKKITSCCVRDSNGINKPLKLV